LAFEAAGRRRRDRSVDAPNERLAVEAAAEDAQPIAGLEVLHGRFIVAHVVVRLPQGEMERSTMARRQVRLRQRGAHPRDQRAVVSREFLAACNPGPRADGVGGKLDRPHEAHGRLRGLAGFAQQLAERHVGFRVLRELFDNDAPRGERLIERAEDVHRPDLGEAGGHGPGSQCRRGAEGLRRFDPPALRLVQSAKPHMGRGQIRFERDRGSIVRDRLLLLAEAVKNLSQMEMRVREAGIEANSGGERLDRLFHPPRGQESEAEKMAPRGGSRIEFDRAFEQGDRLSRASLVHQARAFRGMATGLARLGRLCRAGPRRALRRAGDIGRLHGRGGDRTFHEDELEINGS
jgi:hypothetical protein